MPSAKHNSTIDNATRLLSLLQDVVSSQGMPFCQPQQLQCLHHGSTEPYLCSPLYSITFFTTAQETICSTSVMTSVQELVTTLLAEQLLILFFLWYATQRVQDSWQQSVIVHTFSSWSLGVALIFKSEFSIFFQMDRSVAGVIFMLFLLCNRLNITAL